LYPVCAGEGGLAYKLAYLTHLDNIVASIDSKSVTKRTFFAGIDYSKATKLSETWDTIPANCIF